jgi:hypothetical protein
MHQPSRQRQRRGEDLLWPAANRGEASLWSRIVDSSSRILQILHSTKTRAKNLVTPSIHSCQKSKSLITFHLAFLGPAAPAAPFPDPAVPAALFPGPAAPFAVPAPFRKEQREQRNQGKEQREQRNQGKEQREKSSGISGISGIRERCRTQIVRLLILCD